jgi:hypothetical protein
MSDLRINPETFMIDGLERRTFTAGEFARIEPPSCPVCGAKVSIDRIDVTFNAEEEARTGRSYIAGRWECPHDCDPRTGQRMHYSQSFETGMGWEGVKCMCSCGDETVTITTAESDAWRAVHQRTA